MSMLRQRETEQAALLMGLYPGRVARLVDLDQVKMQVGPHRASTVELAVQQRRGQVKARSFRPLRQLLVTAWRLWLPTHSPASPRNTR